MSKKFFTLITSGAVHAAPQSKVIPSAEFSSLLGAQDLLAAIKKEAEEYRKSVIKECELLKEQAQAEGFNEGLKRWGAAIADLEEHKKSAYKEVRDQIIPIALKAAKKIVHREIDLSEDVIVDIVSGNLKPVLQHRNIVIYVNKQDFDAIEKSRQQLKDLFESVDSFSVRERADVARSGCVIETEKGIINAQIENLWRALEQAFGKIGEK